MSTQRVGPTPFELDTARKREYLNPRLRSIACAECGVIRKLHFGVVGHRFRRMNDREWADYCGVEAPPRPEGYLRAVTEIEEPKAGGLAGLYYFGLECGHREERFIQGVVPEIPKVLKCATCAKTKNKGELMSWLNGRAERNGNVQPAPGYVNGEARADVTAPAPVETAHVTAAPIRPNSNNPFAKAVKYAAKGRTALVGPAGSGKTYTMLMLARALAGPNGKIAAIDTEHGSMSKYADVFDFDVLELSSFTPESFIETLHAAEENHYDVFCCDSLSHFWVGKDGALEFVDMAAKRHKDNMGGWKEFRPHERMMVDEMVSSPCHVICTMRTKTEFVEQIIDGKKKRVKIGLAPVQREGLEYEFDLVGYMDEENTFITDKTRCSHYSQKAFTKPGPKEFAPFVEWLKGEARTLPVKPTAEPRIDTGGHPMNTAAAAQYVAEQKIAAGSPASQASWRTMGECERAFAAKREEVGELQFREVLDRYGWKGFPDIRKALDSRDNPSAREKARIQAAECYSHLDAIARKGVA